MTNSVRMGKGQSHVTEKILDLTLEIIYLLTGEEYQVTKKLSGEPFIPSRCLHSTSPTPETPTHRLTTERSCTKKILEVTNRIIMLLTGEVPIRCQDVTVYFSMEEWEYLEGHKDLYKDVMMEDQPPLTSPADGCDVRNTSERRLLSPAECTTEENVITQDSPEVNPDTQNIHHRPCCSETSMDPSDQGESSDQSPTVTGNISLRTRTTTDAAIQTELFFENKRHEGINEGEQSYTCSVCGKCFRCRKDFVKHRYIHSNKRPHSCSECGKSFRYKSDLVDHQIIHTDERPHTCPVCGKCFNKKNNLARHEKTHTGERPFSCPECWKCFSEERSLVHHLRVHTGERPHSCSVCGKSYIHKRNLVSHLQTHPGQQSSSYSEEGKPVRKKFVNNRKIHTEERPYSCSECGKSFGKKKNLLCHMRVHTGERPYSCSECGKAYADRSMLVLHQRVHTGERPYSCSECGKSFIGKRNLVQHQKIHTGESKPSHAQKNLRR